MFKLFSVLAIVGLLVTSNVSYARDRYYDSPRREYRGHDDTLPFIVGAVIGGIVIHEIERPSPPVVYRNIDDIVYVNGIRYRYITRCDIDTIVQDRQGNDVVIRGACNRILVPAN